MKKSCCIFLAAALVMSQFGCASMPKPTTPAEITESEPWSIIPVQPDTVSYKTFHRKIAELKGNIFTFHASDTAYAALSRSIEQLDDEQNVTEKNVIQGSNKIITICAAAAAAVTLGVVAVNSGKSKRNDSDLSSSSGSGLDVLMFLIVLPVATGAGALTGALAADAINGPVITPEQTRRLSDLILAYNSTLHTTKVRDSSATK